MSCDGHTRLRRALERHADAADIPLAIIKSDATRWASATFIGARHAIEVSLADRAQSQAWLAQLPEAELAVRGHLVADLTIRAVRCDAAGLVATLEALTVEDPADA